MNKTAQVRAALLEGKVLTIRGIAREYDINCPYGVIRDIRNGGLNVSDRLVKRSGKSDYKEYYLGEA